MSMSLLEKKKQKMMELQNAIKKEEEKIELSFGKKLLQSLKISHSEIADKENLEMLINSITTSFSKNNIDTTSKEVTSNGSVQ